MEDRQIIALYWQRRETAICESQKKYGSYCMTIAQRILSSREDSEECVNGTWLRAWNAMPPQKPARLRCFLGTITRNLAINRWNAGKAEKRSCPTAQVMEEFWECIPDPAAPIEESLALKQAINGFLESLEKRDRILFLQRYWYVMPIRDIAKAGGLTESNVGVILHRTRQKFRTYLEKEGVFL